jgi:hypothetical protein
MPSINRGLTGRKATVTLANGETIATEHNVHELAAVANHAPGAAGRMVAITTDASRGVTRVLDTSTITTVTGQ